MNKVHPKTRTDLIGLTGSVTRRITIIDAKEYPTGVSVRVSDETGEEYWTELEDIELDD
ncbi:hypothetical protein [Parageobacillus thermoglucosidasius]|uniref:hypothetical protein n=1 Tax=Parageobacillus thermoglucosidasius TaxID=1426 RepID=UPI002E1B185C|nr:hypothetical protein [Parageobacillus thermoglucosidasius]MED4946467.1 hypothetical protein [Parageobacillus thermoglucosidasius]MED4984028.1 hypothetical protein [Parageobacillus thermoglucosidasius]